MAGWLILAVLLFVVSGSLIVLEMLLPSFGLLSLASLGCFVGSLAVFYRYDILGIGFAASVVVIPVTLLVAYKWFPKSSLGRSVLLQAEIKEPGLAVPDSDKLKSLQGQDGMALTMMRPVGKCLISGQKYACLAETGFIKKGTKVKVISVKPTEIVVRAIDEDDMS